MSLLNCIYTVSRVGFSFMVRRSGFIIYLTCLPRTAVPIRLKRGQSPNSSVFLKDCCASRRCVQGNTDSNSRLEQSLGLPSDSRHYGLCSSLAKCGAGSQYGLLTTRTAFGLSLMPMATAATALQEDLTRSAPWLSSLHGICFGLCWYTSDLYWPLGFCSGKNDLWRKDLLVAMAIQTIALLKYSAQSPQLECR